MQVRDKNGKITTVSGMTGDKLVQAGTHTYVKTGIATKSGYNAPTEEGPSIWNRFLTSLGMGGVTGDYSPTTVGSQMWQMSTASTDTGIKWEPDPGGPEDPYRRWTQFDFTDDEQAAVDRYIDHSFGEANAPTYDENGNMTYGGFASWWSVGADGAKIKVNQGDWNIEHDGQNKGWSDEMIAYVSNEYHAQAGSSYATGASASQQAGLYGDQPTTGGGRGGGGGGPVYVSPMRETVEDVVKSMLTTLTGDPADALVTEYSDLYLKAHKQSWDIARTGGEGIDPNQVVLEAIRGQEDYLRIHALRPESSSETRWIPDQVARQSQLGVDAKDADERGIWMAQMGVNLNDVETGKFQMGKGRKDITMFNDIEKAAQLVVGQL